MKHKDRYTNIRVSGNVKKDMDLDRAKLGALVGRNITGDEYVEVKIHGITWLGK